MSYIQYFIYFCTIFSVSINNSAVSIKSHQKLSIDDMKPTTSGSSCASTIIVPPCPTQKLSANNELITMPLPEKTKSSPSTITPYQQAQVAEILGCQKLSSHSHASSSHEKPEQVLYKSKTESQSSSYATVSVQQRTLSPARSVVSMPFTASPGAPCTLLMQQQPRTTFGYHIPIQNLVPDPRSHFPFTHQLSSAPQHVEQKLQTDTTSTPSKTQKDIDDGMVQIHSHDTQYSEHEKNALFSFAHCCCAHSADTEEHVAPSSSSHNDTAVYDLYCGSTQKHDEEVIEMNRNKKLTVVDDGYDDTEVPVYCCQCMTDSRDIMVPGHQQSQKADNIFTQMTMSQP